MTTAQFLKPLGFHSLLVFIIGIAASFGAPPAFPKPTCSFSNQEYHVDQTWFKYLRTPNLNTCVRCTCKSVSTVHSMDCTQFLKKQEVLTISNA
ncbi:uncharacterized protein CDAR_562171 [Caerostris darwini]|uniref:Secreted protein n=1 Tax=Caerostris darwini TaxID=1538125 RepID=A0AAV4PCD7_9ARAC|nr:uncharacterized protein CDAR_562171 [Caerostris darwini]